MKGLDCFRLFFFFCSLLKLFHGIELRELTPWGGMSYLRRHDWTVMQKFLEDRVGCQSGFWDRKEKNISQSLIEVEAVSLMKFECLGSRLLFPTGNILSHLWEKVYTTFRYNFPDKYPDFFLSWNYTCHMQQPFMVVT